MEVIISLAVFYHLLALVASAIGVFQALCLLKGVENQQKLIRPLIRFGEVHLWISGVIIIAFGVYQKGLPYLENPKLWTKVVLVLAWTINSAMICRFVRSASPAVRARMFGISLASLAYGSFLGVAKPLANGVAPFWMLLAGYIVSLLLAIAFLNQTQRAQMAVAA